MTTLGDLIQNECTKYKVPVPIAASVVWQESKGESKATRFELKFFNTRLLLKTRSQLAGYVPPQNPANPRNFVSLITEKQKRATSYGVFQVLGETARSVLRYDGTFLQDISFPELNVSLGVKYLHLMHTKYALGVKDDLSSWGTPLRYYNGSKTYPPFIYKHIDSNSWKSVMDIDLCK